MSQQAETQLDELNALLVKEDNLPDFRRHVDRSGRNLDFLRKKYRGNNQRVRELSQLSLNQLLGSV